MASDNEGSPWRGPAVDLARAASGGGDAPNETVPLPHPIVWTILYFPFGALGGFITVALTFLATRHGLSVTEGASLGFAQLLSQWWKWTWAPMIDVTLTPKRWYNISTVASAAGIVAMATIPLSPSTLWLLLLVVAIASLVNSIVGMSIESIIAAVTPRDQIGRTSAWFQAGNLGGAGVGGGLGLILLQVMPQPWMAGAILGGIFILCGAALWFVPDPPAHDHGASPVKAFQSVFRDVFTLARTKGGVLAAWLCFLPVGTGAAQGTLTQASVAAMWGAGDSTVAWLQGLAAGVITAIGCFVGGWLCDRMAPRTAYAAIGLALAATAVGMAVSPYTWAMYVGWNVLYMFLVGLAYAAFTAVVLDAIGVRSAATKYNLYASLSNFPIWWLGMLLGWSADSAASLDSLPHWLTPLLGWTVGLHGPRTMLLTEAILGVIGVGLFLFAAKQIVPRTGLLDEIPDEPIT